MKKEQFTIGDKAKAMIGSHSGRIGIIITRHLKDNHKWLVRFKDGIANEYDDSKGEIEKV